MIALSRHICEELNQGRPFATAAILSHKGSTPRTSGSRMLVRAGGSIAGTIGGGLVEAQVMEACSKMLDKNRSAVMDFTLDQELKEGMDMVCGGSLTVWIRSFVPPFSPGLVQSFQRVQALGAGGGKGALITRMTAGEPRDPCLLSLDRSGLDPAGLGQAEPGDAATGSGALLPRKLLSDLADGKFPGPAPVWQVYDLEDFMIEPILPKEMLYIFGAGHVGFQLGQMAPGIGFSTVIIDDRAEFADPERFGHAAQVLAVDFDQAFDRLEIRPGAFIVIVTRGHLHDQVVLEQALKTDAAYIGMIGSRKKRDQIYGNLMEKGIEPSSLEQVRSPIGTQIRAETPAEIAVSIMGELILERAGLKDKVKSKDETKP